MRIVALAGGTGSAKLLRGLSLVEERFTVIANVGDNYWFHGLYVCPDIDITMYTLAGIANPESGWGVKRDTFNVLRELEKLGEETWFSLGDKDLATQVYRLGRLRSGRTLTQVTTELSRRLGIAHRIIPCTDDPLETHLLTDRGSLHLQEFWVREKARPKVVGVDYRGSASARPTKEALDAIDEAERIIVCPANPVTSIMPILSVRGIREALERAEGRKVAISPMVGGGSFSGPAGSLMSSLGLESTSLAVARLYKSFLDCFLIDTKDGPLRRKIEEEGVRCVKARTLMRTRTDAKRLAKLALVV